MAAKIPATVVSVQFSAHLREDGPVNQRDSLTSLISSTRVMVHHLVWSLIALSGRMPTVVKPEKIPGIIINPIRTALGMKPGVTCDPHWLWSYLSDGLVAKVPVVRLAHLRTVLLGLGVTIPKDAIQGRRFVVELDERPRHFTLLPHGDDWVVARDGRDAFKRDAWDKAAAIERLSLTEEISPGDSSPYYLAGWILGEAQPPAQLVAGDPAKATALPSVIAAAFSAAVSVTVAWRQQVAEALGRPVTDLKVTAHLRRSLAACCYEALKQVRSWVELDRQAAEERARREDAFQASLLQIEEPLRAQVSKLLDAISARAEHSGVMDPDSPVISPGSLTWKTCEAIRTFLTSGRLSFERGDEQHPWTHPDWEAFWEEFGADDQWRAALTALVQVVPPADEDAPSIGEIHRSFFRAQGYAALSLTDRVRLHVDRSNAGTNGTLASATDPNQPQRARGARGKEPTAIISPSVEWLGRSYPLEFHVGRNRSLAIVDGTAEWNCVFKRNIRTAESMTGVCKAFDVSVSDSHVRIDLPIQMPVESFGDLSVARQLAVGGWYRLRPAAEPSSPARAIQPREEARVLGVDIGVVPIGGYSAIERSGSRYYELDSGVIGDLTEKDPTIFVHGLHLRQISRAVHGALQLRSHLNACQQAAQAKRDLPETPARLVGAGLGDLATTVRLCVTAGRGAAVQRSCCLAMGHLIEGIARLAAAPGTKGYAILIGEGRYGGDEIPADAHPVLVERLLATVMASSDVPPDADVREILLALLRPLVSLLLGYQRMRACRSDLGTVSKKLGNLDDETMCRRRDAIAVRHGYESEADYFAILHLGATSSAALKRSSMAAHDRALTIRNLLADLWERASSLGTALAGMGLRPQERGSLLLPNDPRYPWNQAYGFLRRHAAAIREEAHKGLAARIVQVAKQYHCTAIAIERLDLMTSSRADRESNGLTRRFAAKEWMAMIQRAADLAGVTIVQVDAWWSSTEIAPLQTGNGLAPRCVGVRHRGDLHTLDGTRVTVPGRVNAARNIALRSLSGNAQHARFPVVTNGTAAVLVKATVDGKGAWSVWQDRMAQDLGRDGAADLWWTIDAQGQAALGKGPAPKITTKNRTSLIAIGQHQGKPAWLTAKAFQAREQDLTKRLQREARASA